ncbi:cobalt ABC transporter permease [Roseibium sp.]|uniref:cobalt ABC transporter permease n=1 Tax=Roseibium sp. TaxID=1936156 RepID=UPI003BAEDFF4
MKYAKILGTALLFLVTLAGHPALAHKVIVSVFASGETIEGEIGFSNGDMATDTLVEVFDGDGNKLGEVTTDSDGFFSFRPSQRVVHVFRANLGSGHVAEVRMELEELPDIPGGPQPATGADSTPVVDTSVAGNVHENETAAVAAAPMIAAALEQNREMLREMIHREVTPLRRELAAYKEKNDLQTILGGIGYIFGLFGLFFYLAARRKLAGG